MPTLNRNHSNASATFVLPGMVPELEEGFEFRNFVMDEPGPSNIPSTSTNTFQHSYDDIHHHSVPIVAQSAFHQAPIPGSPSHSVSSFASSSSSFSRRSSIGGSSRRPNHQTQTSAGTSWEYDRTPQLLKIDDGDDDGEDDDDEYEHGDGDGGEDLEHEEMHVVDEPPQALASIDLENDEPLYVNAKQYERILKRRAQRQRLEELGKVAKARKVRPLSDSLSPPPADT